MSVANMHAKKTPAIGDRRTVAMAAISRLEVNHIASRRRDVSIEPARRFSNSNCICNYPILIIKI